MKTILKIGTCLILVFICSAAATTAADVDRVFFRIFSDTNTGFRSINAISGDVAWSNSIKTNICSIEIAEDLSLTNAWRPYILAVTTSKVYSVQLFDLDTPDGMVFIPEAPFAMGNSFPTNDHDCGTGAEIVEYPHHTVTVSKFYIETHEVTAALWVEIANWATNNGYDFSENAGANPKGDDHPAGAVSWYDCIKWCNARSEMESLTACYYTDSTKSAVYRSGDMDITNACVNWNATGYRLPTEAEWEKACRGGRIGWRFPWGDEITHSNANYCSYELFSTNTYDAGTGITNCFYDVSTTRLYHPAYSNSEPCTAPVGSFAPNDYGLYDVSGNVNEWCWDWYGKLYYQTSPASDPRGPVAVPTATNEFNRILRGGGWYSWDASLHRNAYRMGNPPGEKTNNRGFRCARSRIK